MLTLLSFLFNFAMTLASSTLPATSNANHPQPNPQPRPIASYTAQDIISKLNLTSNPEGGYFSQTFEDANKYGNRSVSTAIYYLLEGSVGESLWHKVDAAEVWHWYAGAPLTWSLSWNNGSATREACLGPELFEGQRPQVVVGKDEWQSARSEGSWTLVGTTVAPGFVESGTVIMEKGWEPRGA